VPKILGGFVRLGSVRRAKNVVNKSSIDSCFPLCYYCLHDRMCEVMREFAQALQRQANLLFTKIMDQVCFL